jgi:hypothetical protein
MSLFDQLISTELIKSIRHIIYSYYIKMGDKIKASNAAAWRTTHTPNQLWEILLYQLPSVINDVNNRDTHMKERLTKLNSEIPFTTASGMKLIGQIEKITDEAS